MRHWTAADRAGFIFIVLFGILIGGFAGAGHFDPYEKYYWLHVGLWVLIGGGLGLFLASLRRLMRSGKSARLPGEKDS